MIQNQALSRLMSRLSKKRYINNIRDPTPLKILKTYKIYKNLLKPPKTPKFNPNNIGLV